MCVSGPLELYSKGINNGYGTDDKTVNSKIYQIAFSHYEGGTLKTDGMDLETKITLNTIEIPVEVGFKLLNLNVVSLNIMGGPSASFVVKEEIEINKEIENPITEDHIKNTIWNFNLGVGVDVLMFTFDVRYNWGLNNILEPIGEQSNEMKNNMWTVSLGWKIL